MADRASRRGKIVKQLPDISTLAWVFSKCMFFLSRFICIEIYLEQISCHYYYYSNLYCDISLSN